MHDLLQRFAAEHSELQQALAGIRPPHFKTDEGRTRLNRVRDLMRSHLAEEEKQLYKPLEKAARKDDRLAGNVRRMTDELSIISGLAEDFFAKYEQGVTRLVEFATDHCALLTILQIRLKREEEMLFPLFDRITEN